MRRTGRCPEIIIMVIVGVVVVGLAVTAVSLTIGQLREQLASAWMQISHLW